MLIITINVTLSTKGQKSVTSSTVLSTFVAVVQHLSPLIGQENGR